MRVKVCDDLFNISSRIKNVDRSYYIVFNTNLCVYEVHSTMQKNNSFCFTVGDRLDYYAIVRAQKTSIKRLKSIIKNIDKNNIEIEEKANKEISYKIRTNLRNYLGLYW